MAKDPAVLFYTSDFLSGTMLLSDEQVGQYIRLLCLQHQKGALTEKDIIKICGSYDEDIFSKFTKEGDLFFNKRMKEESEKRKAYSESRSKNRKKASHDKDINNISKSYDKTYVEHMENENENENINTIEIKKGGVGENKTPVSDTEAFNGECIYISGEPVADLYSYLDENIAMQVQSWQKSFPLANVQEACKQFLAVRMHESFKDLNHIRNAFRILLTNLQEKNQKQILSTKMGKVEQLLHQNDKLQYDGKSYRNGF